MTLKWELAKTVKLKMVKLTLYSITLFQIGVAGMLQLRQLLCFHNSTLLDKGNRATTKLFPLA
jgi:hypothetical protein